MKIEEIENELKIPHEGYCNLDRNFLLKLMAVAKAAKASLKNAALICDEDIILEKALEELEKE